MPVRKRSLQAAQLLYDAFGDSKKIFSLRGGIPSWLENKTHDSHDRKKTKNIFVDGPITAAFIGEKIQQHHTKTGIGGHSIFLGQVRADVINDQPVTAIEYTAYQEMALEKMQAIREAIFDKYPSPVCMFIIAWEWLLQAKISYSFLLLPLTGKQLSMPVRKQ